VYICIIARIGSSLLFFSFLPQYPSYGNFNRFRKLYIHSFVESTATILDALQRVGKKILTELNG
jgi:hypothetical protein